MRCIFDLEFLSNSVSLTLSLSWGVWLLLFLCQFVTFSLALCLSLFLPQPLFSELAVTLFILFQLLILKFRLSGPPSLPLGSVGGWGGGVAQLAAQDILHFLNAADVAGSKFGGLGMGREGE